MTDHEAIGVAQLAHLRARLMPLLGWPEEPEGATGKWWTDDATGQIIVWWEINGCAYYEKDGVIYVEREAHGAIEWTWFDNGEPIEPWRRTVPPRRKLIGN